MLLMRKTDPNWKESYWYGLAFAANTASVNGIHSLVHYLCRNIEAEFSVLGPEG